MKHSSSTSTNRGPEAARLLSVPLHIFKCPCMIQHQDPEALQLSKCASLLSSAARWSRWQEVARLLADLRRQVLSKMLTVNLMLVGVLICLTVQPFAEAGPSFERHHTEHRHQRTWQGCAMDFRIRALGAHALSRDCADRDQSQCGHQLM